MMKKRKPAKKHAKKHAKKNPAHHYAAKHAAPKKHSRRRRNPGGPMMDVLTGAGAAAATFVVWDIVGAQLNKIDAIKTNPMIGKAAQAALGIGAAFLLRKRPALAIGVAAGSAGAVVGRVVEGYLPASVLSAVEMAPQPYALPGAYAPALPMGAVELGAVSIGDAERNYQQEQYDPAALVAAMFRG